MAQTTTTSPVAYLGPQASYCHQAALKAFPCIPDSAARHTLVPHQTFEDVFSAVQSGTADRGVIPIENSTNGAVAKTLDLLADPGKRYPDVLVCAETYVEVRHCLLGHKAQKRAITSIVGNVIAEDGDRGASIVQTSSADYSRIEKLYSHNQAWSQCRSFLDTHFDRIKREDVTSTARAAEIVAGDTCGTLAAISSPVAAEVFGLDVLASGIQDRDDNVTRFLILSKRNPARLESWPSMRNSRCGEQVQHDQSARYDQESNRWKTLVAFTVAHKNPGALADSLAVFKPYYLNLTSINARPSGVAPWNYVFLVEVGHNSGVAEEPEADGALAMALHDLARVVQSWRWLGSWENKLTPTY